MIMRNYKIDYSRYTFNEEDEWGDYDNEKYRNGYFDKNGYCLHSYLCDDGRFHTVFEHIAKWEYFMGNIPEGLEIDHIIPVKNGGTNRLSNLRCVTHGENMNNYTTKSLMHLLCKDQNRNKKISDKLKGKKKSEEHRVNSAKGHWKKVYQYTKDNILIRIWDTALQAKDEGYCLRNIYRCCTGERKSHKGYKWSYIPL